MQNDTFYNSRQCGYGPIYVDREQIYPQVAACTFQLPVEYCTTPHEPRDMTVDGCHFSINSQTSLPSPVLGSNFNLHSSDSQVSDSRDNLVPKDLGQSVQKPATHVFAWMETRQNTKQKTHGVHSGNKYTS